MQSIKIKLPAAHIIAAARLANDNAKPLALASGPVADAMARTLIAKGVPAVHVTLHLEGRSGWMLPNA